MSDDFERRPGQARGEESYRALEQYYGRYADKVADRAEVTDNAEAKKDPLYPAKKVAEDTIRAFMVLAEDQRLGPAEMIFAMELASLNVLNARDCPLSDEQVNKVRAKALRYYETSLPAVPDEPKP